MWDMVSDTEPLVVVFVTLTVVVPVVDGMVKDLAPSAGSVLTANELLALAYVALIVHGGELQLVTTNPSTYISICVRLAPVAVKVTCPFVGVCGVWETVIDGGPVIGPVPPPPVLGSQ